MNPDPTIAWGIIGTAAVLAVLAVNIVTLARIGKSQKREVTFGEEFAPKAEVMRRLDRIENDVSEVNRQRRSDVSALHDELGNVRESVAAVESETANMGKQVATLTTGVGEINRQLGVIIGRLERKA